MREEIKTDCFFFNGYKPCKFHKQSLVHCPDCPDYRKFNKKILIIKLQAAGEVIRNTPLLRKIHQDFPYSKIYWLTKYPELLPEGEIFKILPFSLASLIFLLHEEFDIIYSLDKDLEAASLACLIKAKLKKGFSVTDGAIVPFDQDAVPKWLTGILDDKMKANTRHYVEELFEICGFQWSGEEYILPEPSAPDIPVFEDGRTTIGLNTGAGAIWPTRIWSEERWMELIGLLKKDLTVLLLGGPGEDGKNKNLAQKTGALYFGVFPYRQFMGLIGRCDLIVTSVTMALHIAIGLKKKIVLLNNIFPSCEFYLYGLGKILEPPIDCLGCYKTAFDRHCTFRNCLDLVTAQKVETTIRSLL
ncbi:MAG: glycosyltransferase family 9 protein [bacterium]